MVQHWCDMTPLVIKGAMKMTPTAAMEVILRLPPLHVTNAAKPRQSSTDYCVPNSGDLNPLTLVTPNNLRIYSKNLSYRWGLTGCY